MNETDGAAPMSGSDRTPVAMNSRPGNQSRTESSLLAALHQLSPNPLVVVDAAGKVTLANKAAMRALDSIGLQASPGAFLPKDIDGILGHLRQREPATFLREVEVGSRVFKEYIQVRPDLDAAVIHATDITELRQTEQELRRQSAFLTALVESPSDVIIFALDREYRYTAFNAAHKKEIKKVYGVDISTGMNILDIINIPEIRAKAKRSIDHALSGESFYEVEVQPDLGIWYAFDWSPVRAPDGSVEGATAFIRDITRRKQTEAALAGSELKYRSLFEGSNDAIMLLDSERFLDCNAATLKVFGYTTRDDFLGKHPADVSPSRQADGRDSHVAADENIATAFRVGRDHFEWLHQRADGSVFPADVLLTPVEFGGRRVLQATVRDVSDRKQAEAALSESEERFRRAFDDSRVGKLLTGLDGRLLRVNRAFAVMLGYSIHELQSGDFQAVTHPDDVALSVNVMKRLQTGTEGSARFEKRYLHKSGSVVWVELSAVLLRDSNGRPDHFVADVQDISGRKQAEAALSESEERYRRLVDEMGEGIGVADADERFLFSNPAAEELFGVARGGLIGRSLFDFLDAEEAELVKQQTANRRDGRRGSYELEITRPDRTKRIALVTVSPRHDASGNFDGSFAIFRDISDRKRAELRSKQHLADTILLRDTALGFITLDQAADIYGYVARRLAQLAGEAYIVVSSYDETQGEFHVRAIQGTGDSALAALKLLGQPQAGMTFRLAPEELHKCASSRLMKVDGGLPALSSGELPAAVSDAIKSVFALGETYAMSFYWQGKMLGTVYILMHKDVPLRDPALVEAFVNQSAIAIQHRRDADELLRHRGHLEELVRERTVELEAANQELEAFSYSASHDLRAPLRAIDGFAQALIEDAGPALSQQARGHLDRVSAAAGRMGELIDDLLNLARIARLPLERKEVNLSDLARSITAELRRAAPNRRAEFVIADGLTAPVDPVLAEMVMRNLLANAWKFTSGHPTARIEFGTTRGSGKPLFFVRDDGVGFDMAYAAKLFVPFERLHSEREFPGSGIGLAIVHRIVRRHGGRVWFEAEVNGGATCWFTLEPLSKEVERGRES